MILDPPVSKNLRRHGDSQLVFQLMMFGIALMFWAAAKATPGPVMPDNIYGAWVTGFAAELWAGSIMLAAFLFLMGIMINGEWRWSPVLRLVGAAWHCVTLAAFIAGASNAAQGQPFVLMCAGAIAPHLWFVWLNIGDCRQAIRGRA